MPMIDLTLRQQASASNELFGMFEEARSRNLQDSLGKAKPRLSEVQSALPPRSMLLEYWLGAGRVAVLWIAKDTSGLVTRPLAAGDLEAISALPDALQHAADSHWREDLCQRRETAAGWSAAESRHRATPDRSRWHFVGGAFRSSVREWRANRRCWSDSP